MGVLPISNCINNVWWQWDLNTWSSADRQGWTNKWVWKGLERSNTRRGRFKEDLLYDGSKIFWVIVQKKSLGWWTKENLLDDGPKKVFRMMNQRRYFSWRPKEDILYDGPKKIFWMKAKKIFWIIAKRRSFGWWTK